MSLPYPYSPPHPPYNHRRCLQDNRLLNGRLSLGLSKSCVFIGDSTSLLHKLERIRLTLAQVVTRQHGRSSISAILHNRHWLPIKWRIDFKVATLTYKVLQSWEPSYLSSRIAIAIPRRLLRSSSVKIKIVLFQTGLPIKLSSILHCASDLTTADPLSGRLFSMLRITNLHNNNNNNNNK